MPKTIHGEQCRRGLPLTRILREWRKLNEQIATEWADWRDVPWWYNERASLSVLAGAVWNAGDFAFEEFSDEKRKISRRSSKFGRTYSGRVDLYFNADGKDYIGEAKICWPRCGNSKSKKQQMIEAALSESCMDIRKTRPKGQRRLGIVFVSPRWKTNLRHELESRIDDWISKVRTIECDAVAWTFPACARTRRAHGYFYPGAVVLIRKV